jgi:hypothetical protein
LPKGLTSPKISRTNSLEKKKEGEKDQQIKSLKVLLAESKELNKKSNELNASLYEKYNDS